MIEKIITIFLLLITLNGHAQTDPGFVFDSTSLDQKTEKGHKHGYWVSYLSQEMKPCKEEKAYFYGYELYDQGERVQKFYYERFKKRCKLETNIKGDTTIKPILLNGTFEWYKKNGRIAAREVYKNGRPFFIKSFKFSRKNPGVLVFSENLYYDKLYSDKVGTFYYERHSKGKVIYQGFFRKRDRGWKVYRNPIAYPKSK
ncbi:MAG: hypothetical protein JKY18_05265 [Flavobacteriales bacterium]|nr:hypothetical protein [Flavobacteriales bacterium]